MDLIKVVLVDHQDGVHRGVKWLLDRTPGFKLLKSFYWMEDMLKAFSEGLEPDLLIMHLGTDSSDTAPHRPDIQEQQRIDAIDAANEVRRRYQRLPIIIYSARDKAEILDRWAKTRLINHYGLLTRGALLTDALGEIMRKVVQGDAVVDPELRAAKEVRDRLEEQSPQHRLQNDEQWQILELIADGLTNSEIAARIKFGPDYVGGQITRIYAALGVTDDEGGRVARVRASRIFLEKRMLVWHKEVKHGREYVQIMAQDAYGDWRPLDEVKAMEQSSLKIARDVISR